MALPRRIPLRFAGFCWALGLALAPLATAKPAPERVDFQRQIRPLLSDNCFECHGPDAARRRARLRLDTREGLFSRGENGEVVIPGKSRQSVLYRRVATDDDAERMPPPDSGKQLTPEEVELLRRWIDEGADWRKHWAFVPPRRPALPHVRQTSWPRGAIDHFVLARLERDELSPSSEAPPQTLIRRVTLDLTGLPPTAAEVDRFLSDPRPDAYERAVDRLLGSPRYGERLALPWLDAARYADTSGYQNDGVRHMWRWRDWVMAALNDNMPFDRFTLEQLAGDMLPDPSLDQLIATGFNRNHRGNSEGGIIPEEYRVEYVVDRVETTATVWLGLTLGCARCHDHKYDPISQEEFYRIFAYFNNVPERGKARKIGNAVPWILAPLPGQETALRSVESELAAAELEREGLNELLRTRQRRWEEEQSHTAPEDWTVTRELVARLPLDGVPIATTGETQVRFDGLDPTFESGPLGGSLALNGKGSLGLGDIADFGFFDKISITAWIYPKAQSGGVVSRMIDTFDSTGYSFHLQDGRLHVALVRRWLDDCVRVHTRARLQPERWYAVAMTYDGSRSAAGVRIYIDGESQPLVTVVDDLNQSFVNDAPLRIGSRGTREPFHGRIDDVRIYGTALSNEEAGIVATTKPIATIAKVSPAARSPGEKLKIDTYFLATAAPEAVKTAHRRVSTLREKKRELIESFPTSMVMQEMPEPRATFVLQRGSYDNPGKKVSPGVPDVLPGLPADASNNRLGFAKWLVSPEQPLTARVVVNRYWQLLFGSGLVRTVEDFGAQGERPTHPHLLDWLATKFVSSGWNVKLLLREIVTSATYRQSSRATPAMFERDPHNLKLARGPRFRLSAAAVRDQALALGSLLVERIGGPSVRPYQPEGLWKEVSGSAYERDQGENLYRRSIYTFWKRTVAPPSMLAFDASTRELCVVRQTRTNTPLQALHLMNDVAHVEAARVFAERTLEVPGATAKTRLRSAFREATGRYPGDEETTILLDGLAVHGRFYRENPEAARQLSQVGDQPASEALDLSELAAYTAICSMILNLDETVTKE